MRLLLFLIALLAAAPAMAQVRAVPEQPASEAEALRGVEVFLMNEGDLPLNAEGPGEIEVTAADGTRLVLQRVPGPLRTIAPGGFAKARYVPVGIANVAPPTPQFAPAPMPGEGETAVASATGTSSAFLDRFEPHEPVYGTFGMDDSGARLQVSFAFRPFDGAGPLDGLRFAYTQSMFWALDQPSGPFRATTYSPEVYAQTQVGEETMLALGWRHDSNGRGTGSIDVNRIYVRASRTFGLGGDWRLDVAPQAWLYVGRQGAAPDLSDYWGYTSLAAAIRQENGVKLSVAARGNFETRRGAAELFLSYPLARLGGGLGFYVFGQAFTGDGEALDDYDIRDTHLRIGIALTR